MTSGSGHHPDRKLGYRDGVRAAVTWLHNRAKQMRDPHAKAILDCAADHFGTEMALKSTKPQPTGEAEG